MTLATELVTKATEGHFTHVRLDTADRRGLSNVGKLDAGNVMYALRDGASYLWTLLIKRPRVIYVPVAQAWLPFLRDCLFLIPARLTRRAVIVHLHGSAFSKFYGGTSPVMRWIIRYALGRAACGIVLGKNVESIFDGIIPSERIYIVPNGIPDHFANGVTKPRGNSPLVLLFVGTLVAEKGFLDVLRALPRVKERVGSVRAIFAGEWYSQQDKKMADEIVETLGLGPSVEFVGPVGPDRKNELLRMADLFVFPSANEGQPFVILEAMAAGLPVVSTRIACIPEMVQDELNGYLVEPKDIEGLTEKICVLLADHDLRQRMGAAGRERFLRDFTFDTFAQRMSAVFSKISNDRVPA
jgi:glycosyltransferase involved in cell wall biosynthesis